MDFEKLLQLLELMQMFSDADTEAAIPPGAAVPPGVPTPHGVPPRNGSAGSIPPGAPPAHGQENPGLKMMKAALPYLDFQQQRTMGTMIKLIEIQRLMEAYGAQVGEFSPSEDWRLRLLMGIRPHITDDRKLMIDLLIKLMEIRQILNRMEAGNGYRCGA